MKTKLLTILTICLFASFLSAQTLVKPEDFKLTALRTYLKEKGYSIMEETADYIEFQAPNKTYFYIDGATTRNFLLLNSHLDIKDKTSQDKIKKLVDEINLEPIVKANYIEEKNKIIIEYYFFISHGFTYETLDRAIGVFCYNVDHIMTSLDKEKILK